MGAVDDALLEHQPEHLRPACSRARGMRHRVIEARILRDAGEESGLRERQLRRAVPEVRTGGALDAVGAVPEVDRVEVGGEDPVLRPLLLELPRERRLLELARHRPLVARQRVLHELLRDRRPALHCALVADVGPQRARHSADVDAAVLVEALVLGCDDRLLDPRRDRTRRREHAALGPAQDGEDRVAVGGVHVPVHLLVLVPRRVEPAELLRDREDDAVRERCDGQNAEDPDQRQEAELADPAPAMCLRGHGRGRILARPVL